MIPLLRSRHVSPVFSTALAMLFAAALAGQAAPLEARRTDKHPPPGKIAGLPWPPKPPPAPKAEEYINKIEAVLRN